MRMMFTMKANEMQREIYFKINEESQRQASQFKVVLLNEQERTQLEGIDSCTTVAILDNADNLAVEAAMRLKGTGNLNYIKIIKKAGGSLGDSFIAATGTRRRFPRVRIQISGRN